MNALALVAVGGAIGSVARYLLSSVVLERTLEWKFPLGTFLVNVAGCFAVGLLGALVVKHDLFSANARVFLFSGIAGGFTTFSAFGLETFYLLRRGEALVAGSYVLASVVVGMVVLWVGFSIVSAR
ncbi:MAG TPA: fluoride efflux transporter CrcB [Verrucomicrobiae bacterium]|nr:fluoride efflux transporter CrcB [Verrucomicrobiae bacterium]